MKKQATLIKLATVFMAASVIAVPGASYAEVPGARPHPVRKLGRGLANTIGGLLEVPVNIREVGIEKGPVAGITLGLLVGAGRAVQRTLIGVIETATFPFPLGPNGYEPLLLPEFILEPGSYTQGTTS